MMRIVSIIILSVLFATATFAQSAQTRLNTFPTATTRVTGTQGVAIKGNVGATFTTTITATSGQKLLTGTWRLVSRLGAVPSPVDKPRPPMVYEFSLGQNYPNPFNPTTVIPFSLDKQGVGELRIMNLLGQTLRTFDMSSYSAGPHELSWDGRDAKGSDVSSGIYFYRLTTDYHSALGRMMLIK